MLGHENHRIQEVAHNTAAGRNCICNKDNNDGTYDVRFTDGQVMLSVANFTGYTIPVGTSVTVEMSSNGYQVVGLASHALTFPNQIGHTVTP